MSEICMEVDVEPEKSMPLQEELPCEQFAEEIPANQYGAVDLEQESEEVVETEEENRRNLSLSSESETRSFIRSPGRMVVRDIDDGSESDSLIILINNDGTLSLDPSQLARILGPHSDDDAGPINLDNLVAGNCPGVPVRLLRVTNDIEANCINLVVEGDCDFSNMQWNPFDETGSLNIDDQDQDEVQIISVQPAEKNKRRDEVALINTREIASTSDTGDHNAFIGMDRDQLLRLEKLLKSDEAKQILGENVTAMLDMLTSEEEVPPMTVAMTPLDAIRMDHNYTNLISPSPRAASPKFIPTPTSTAHQAPSTPSQSTVKARGVGRPRKIPRPSPVLSEHLRKQRAQQIRPAHPGATLVPVITPLHIGLSKALKRASEGVGVKVVVDSSSQNIVTLDSDQLISHSKKLSDSQETGPGTSSTVSVPLELPGDIKTPVIGRTYTSNLTGISEESVLKKKKSLVPKKGKLVKGLKRKLVKSPKETKKIKIPRIPKKKNVHFSKLPTSPTAQLLNDAMADALVAMESPPKSSNPSTVDETVAQKDPSLKTYSRAIRSTELNVDIPKGKEETDLQQDTAVSASTVEGPEVAAPLPVFKKHYPKRENRKPPAHLVDAFGPALFSTPDIIRRVSLESKVEDIKSPVVQRPPSPVTEKLPPTIMQSPPLNMENVETQPEEILPMTNGVVFQSIMQPSEKTGPAVIVLMDEAISPSKSTAMAINRTHSTALNEEELAKLARQFNSSLGSEDIMDVSLCTLDSSENAELTFDESQEMLPVSSPIEPSVIASEQSTSHPSVPEDDSKRKRRSVTMSKKKRASISEPARSEKKIKKQKVVEKDSLPSSAINLLLESDDDGDIESDDISWNSEDDPDRLWCICKKPHNNRFMICCDSCNFWFHGKCVGITKAMGSAMELKEEDWTCPACVKKRNEFVADEPSSTKPKKKRSKDSSTLVPGQASTSGVPKTALPEQTKTKVPDKKKGSRNKNPVPEPVIETSAAVVQVQHGSTKPTAGAMTCVVCSKNEARLNSIYCSDTCILLHAQESGQPPAVASKALPPLKEGLHKISPKGPSPKQAGSKGALVKALKVPVKILAKKVTLNSDQGKSSLLKVSQPLSDKPIMGVPRSSLSKKLYREAKNALLATQQTSEGSTEIKGNIKAVQDLKEISKPRHMQLIDMKELPPLLPKPGVANKAPKTPLTKMPLSPTKQLPMPPKVTKSTLLKGSELSTKAKGPTSSPLPSPLKDKVTAKKPDTKRQVSVDSPKKEEERSPGPEPVRINVRKTLFELLQSRIQECDDLKLIPDEKVKKMAQKIEEELFGVFKDTGMRYKSKYRSLVFNIKDPKNLTLFRKIAEKSVTPHQLVRLTPEELASQELADWRERESKHQLEMIKKNELDLMALSKTYVMKTHKGEQVIESEGIIPAATVTEMEESPDSRDGIDRDIDDTEDTKHEVTSITKEKTKKHRSHKEKVRTKLHKKDKSKEKSKRSKGKHREKRRESSKTDKSDKKKRREKDVKKSAVKVVPIVEPHVEEDLTTTNKVVTTTPEKVLVPSSDVGIASPTEQKSKPIAESVIQDTVDQSSAVTIQIPDINSSDPNICLTVWKGFMSMQEVSKFFSTMQIVHGDPGDLFDNLPDTMNVVGRISPTTVWEYISKMKKSGTKDILIIRFTAANEEEQIPYFTLYSYLSGRSRLGVLGRVSKKIKDFYILPLSKHNPVPQVLLPLDGPGFEDNRPHLLLGIVVRSKLKHLSSSSAYKAKIARKYAASPVENSSSSLQGRSYTPPLRDATSQPERGTTPPLLSTSLDYESTPPSSPCESTLAQKIELQIKESSLSLSTLSAKLAVDKPLDDGDEPYSPGGSDDEIPPVNVLGQPSNQMDLQRTMEELNRKIAEQKQQIQTISSGLKNVLPKTAKQKQQIQTNRSAIRAPSTTHTDELPLLIGLNNIPTTEGPTDMSDGDEAYSPSSSFTPPRASSPIITSKDSASTLPQISLPANLQEILANIKKQGDIKSDSIVQNYVARKEESISAGRRDNMYVPTAVTTVIEQPYIPSAITTTVSTSKKMTVATSVFPKVNAETPLKNLPSVKEPAKSKTNVFESVPQDTSKVAVSSDSTSGVSATFCSESTSKSGTSSLSTSFSSTLAFSPLTSQSTSSPSDSSGVFQTIPLMLGAISPSALFPKPEKTSRDPRQDFSDQEKNRLTKYAKRSRLPFNPAEELGDGLLDDEPPPPGVDTPPRPVPPPRVKSPPRPPPPTEVDYVQPPYSCPPPNFQPVGYPLPMLPGTMPGVGYPLRPPYYGPGYIPPPMTMMHPGHLQMGFNPPYQEMRYPGPGPGPGQGPGPSGMYGGDNNQNRQRPFGGGRGNNRWNFGKGKKRGRQEERPEDRDRQEERQRNNQSKEKSHRRDSRDTNRSGHHKKSRNKSRSRDRSK